MTIFKFLSKGEQALAGVGIASARLDCLILLEDLLGHDRAWLLANPDTALSATQLKKLSRQLQRRIDHEPLAYIRGFTEFYGRRFKINKRVLEPRPESEIMINMFKEFSPERPTIADVGTGSGALGITAALESSGAQVDLYDIDSSALAVAKHNANMHEITPGIYKRDLLNRAVRSYDVVLANLPYIPNDWNLDRSIQAEPRIAFFGGKDGLELYRRLFGQLKRQTKPASFILTEAFPFQHEELVKIAALHDYEQAKIADFIQVFSKI